MRFLPLPRVAKPVGMSQRSNVHKRLGLRRGIAEGSENNSDLRFTYSDKKFRVFTEFVLPLQMSASLTICQSGLTRSDSLSACDVSTALSLVACQSDPIG